MELLSKLFYIFFYFFIGYLSKKLKIFEENASQIFIKFIIYISFPALVIFNVYTLKIEKSFLYLIALGWIVIIFSILISFFIGRFLKFDKKKLSTFIIMASFGNTSFLGFPFQKALLGEDALKYAVMIDQLASFLPVVIISPFIISYGKGESKIFKFNRANIYKILTFPPFIALNLGFVLKLFEIPNFILNSLKDLGSLVIPLALFSVGFNLKFSHLKDRFKELTLLIFIKMVLVPILTVLFLLYILNFPKNLEFFAFVIEISMPPMVLASILVVEAKLDKDLAISSVGLGIILSFFIVPLIFIFSKIV